MRIVLGGLLAAIPALLWMTPACAQEQIGVVLMHGKQSTSERMQGLGGAIEAAGFVTEAPEMCWSHRRIYDMTYANCLREIDGAIARLKQKNATVFVIAGQSLGANGALGYGALTKGLKGVIALAPGHRPEFFSRRFQVAASLALARDLTAKGSGGVRAKFTDVNGDVIITVETTPDIYLSFVAPNSRAVMPANAARLTAPLLYVVGTNDPLQKRGPNEIFAKAPPHPLNRYVTVRAEHRNTPAAATPAVVAWLKELAKN